MPAEQRLSLIVTANARVLETEIRRARRETNELGREFREGKRDADRLNRSGDALVREMREMSAAAARGASAMERMATSQERARRATNRTADATQRLARESDRANRILSRGTLDFVKGAAISAGLARAYGLVEQGFRGLTSGAVEAGVAFQGIASVLRTATGGAQGAGTAMGFLREETERLGLNFRASATAFSGFLAAARGTRLEGEAAREVFRGVGEAARVMNLSAADTQGVFTALEQIVSKGTVSAEELRGQLGERLPGAFQIAARAMGVTTQELDKMLRQGELLAEDLLPALARELSSTVAGELPEATGLAAANFERMRNAVEALQIAITQSGLLDFLSDAARGATAFIRALTPIDPGDFEFVAGFTGDLNQLDVVYQRFLRTVSTAELDESTIEAQLAIARRALEVFGEDLLPGQAGFGARQRAQETIERLTGFSRDNIAGAMADVRRQIEDETGRLQGQLEENRARGIDESDIRAQPLIAGENAPRSIRRRIGELNDLLGEYRQVADGYLAVPIEVNLQRRGAPAGPADEDVGDGAAFSETEAAYGRVVRATRTARERIEQEHAASLSAIFAAEGKSADERIELAARVAAGTAAAYRESRERRLRDLQAFDLREIAARRLTAGDIEEIGARIGQRRLQAERDARTRELVEAQGFNSQLELEVERHEQAKLALRHRYGSQAQTQLLQQQREAARELRRGEEADRQAIAQIAAGSLASSLGELGRHNRRAFRASQAAGIAHAVISTQRGIAESLGQPGPLPLRLVYAGLVAAQGAAAIAAIRSQRPPRAFRLGGIVDEPTFFSARNVPRGVAGEAGPEAILPLRRGPGGRLGVETSGARPPALHFNSRIEVKVEAGADPAAAGRTGREIAAAAEAEMERVIARHTRPGGLLNPVAVA